MSQRLGDYLNKHDSNFRRARLPALYADFRSQRTLNPDGYQANLSAWRHALARLALSGVLSRSSSKSGALVIDIDEPLLRSLEIKEFGQPLALGTVVREAMAATTMLPLDGFLQSPQSIYLQSWSGGTWNIVGWALRQLGVVDPARGEDKLPQGTYVVMDNVETAANGLQERAAELPSKFDKIFTKQQFQKKFAGDLIKGQELTTTDIDVLLKFLSRDKSMIAYDGQTIKIKDSGEQGGITEEDTTVASIKELTASLTHQTTLLNSRIDDLEREAKSAISRKNRIAAMAALRAKKIAESSLTNRYSTLHQLEEVSVKLEQASDQVQLVKVMESSAGVLKDLNAQVGGTDRVDDIMDQLREQMSQTDELAAIMAEPGVAVDEAEIDDELEELERQEKQNEHDAQQKEKEKKEERDSLDAQKKLDELPQVPSESASEQERARTPTSETGIGQLSLGS